MSPTHGDCCHQACPPIHPSRPSISPMVHRYPHRAFSVPPLRLRLFSHRATVLPPTTEVAGNRWTMPPYHLLLPRTWIVHPHERLRGSPSSLIARFRSCPCSFALLSSSQIFFLPSCRRRRPCGREQRAIHSIRLDYNTRSRYFPASARYRGPSY